MSLKILRSVVILPAALGLGTVQAHFLEMPAKRQVDPALWPAPTSGALGARRLGRRRNTPVDAGRRSTGDFAGRPRIGRANEASHRVTYA